jgi:hypothetical protein
MAPKTEWTADQWFAEASRWYVEGHQGCASCHGRHCVFRSEWGSRVEYHCTACDFSACHDAQTGQSFVAFGEPRAPAPLAGDELCRAQPSG